MQFNVVELQFRQGVADVVNEYALNGPQPVRKRRQANVAQNVTADNVFIVGPSPLIMNSNLNIVFFVQTDTGTVVNGTELTPAVQNEGATLAQEVHVTLNFYPCGHKVYLSSLHRSFLPCASPYHFVIFLHLSETCFVKGVSSMYYLKKAPWGKGRVHCI